MAQKFGEIKHQLDVSLHDSSKPWTSILEQAEKKTGLDRLYIFAGVSNWRLVSSAVDVNRTAIIFLSTVGGIVLVGLWLVFGYFAQLVCNSVGFLYPAYMSIKAIESKSKDDDTKWLTYWVVFALFSIAEYFADFIVGWFPLYWLIKCIFMVWLMIPTGFNGSLILYNRIIKPYFLKHEHNIDDVVNKVKDSAHKVFDKRE